MTLSEGDCQLYTGTVVSLGMPTIDQIHLDDIIHSLSLQCRFNGHCDKFYSVAEHSVYTWQCYRNMHDITPVVSDYKKRLNIERECMYVLLHDAPEAYLGDIITPLQSQPGLARLKAVERKIMNLISLKFDLGGEPVELKVADNSMLRLEYRKLCKPALPGKEWPCLERAPYPWGIEIACLLPSEAEELFAEKVYEGLHLIEDLRRVCNQSLD